MAAINPITGDYFIYWAKPEGGIADTENLQVQACLDLHALVYKELNYLYDYMDATRHSMSAESFGALVLEIAPHSVAYLLLYVEDVCRRVVGGYLLAAGLRSGVFFLKEALLKEFSLCNTELLGRISTGYEVIISRAEYDEHHTVFDPYFVYPPHPSLTRKVGMLTKYENILADYSSAPLGPTYPTMVHIQEYVDACVSDYYPEC